MPRAIWSGSICFGLVTIPVRVYRGSIEREPTFRLLHAQDSSPIQMVHVCRAEGKRVPFKELVRGYEDRPGRYVVLDERDFERLQPQKAHRIHVEACIRLDEVDPVYIDKPYFLEPDGRSAKAYALLAAGLETAGKAALVRYVLRQRPHLGVITARSGRLTLLQLRYHGDLEMPDLLVPKAKVTEAERAAATELIEAWSAPFVPERYRDTYQEDVRALIRQKTSPKPIRARGRTLVPTQAAHVLARLRASVRERQRS